jgi:uncharacterized protein involved in outer membrane biogenesis
LKWLLAVVAAVVVLTAAAIIALPRLIDVPRVQALVATNASHALGRPVKFASLSVSVFPRPGVTLHKLEVADDPRFATAPFLTLDTGRLNLRLRPLFSGRVEFAEIVLAKPVITVLRDQRGRLNIASLGAPNVEPRPSAPRAPRPGGGPSTTAAPALPATVRITDGVVVYGAEGGPEGRYRVDKLDLALEAAGSQITFKGSARLTPGDVAVKIADGVLTVPPSHVLADAPLRAGVTLDSSDVGPLAAAAMGPAPGVGGAMKGKLAVAGTVGAPTASGDVTLNKLAVTRTTPQCPAPQKRTLTIPTVTLNTTWKDRRLTAQPLRADLPKGTVTARLTADARGVRVQLDDLAVKAMPVESVLVDFLCQGYAVSGPLDLTGTLAFAAGNPLGTMSGDGSLRIGAGKVVGRKALNLISSVVRVGGAVSSLIDADLPASTFTAPVDFESITGTYRITDGLLTTRDLLYTSRAMKVAVAGDYVLASGAMNLDVAVNYRRGEIRARVTGTAAAPSIRVLPASVLRSIDQDKVEAGLRDLLKRFR